MWLPARGSETYQDQAVTKHPVPAPQTLQVYGRLAEVSLLSIVPMHQPEVLTKHGHLQGMVDMQP